MGNSPPTHSPMAYEPTKHPPRLIYESLYTTTPPPLKCGGPQMSPDIYILNSFPNLPKYTRASSLHLHPHHPVITKPRPCCPPLTGNCSYWAPKPAYRCIRASSPRRHAHPSNPSSYYYRNNQPVYSPLSTWGTTNS